jgi:ABC-2 type transport system permease protein
MAVLKVPVHLDLLYLPLILIEYYIFVLGVSFFLAAIFVKFRDVGPIWEVFCQALFYGTPIIYALNTIPPRLVKVMMINPLAQIIQASRAAILPTEVTTSGQILGAYSVIPFLIVALTYVLGYFVFKNMTAKFAEEV